MKKYIVVANRLKNRKTKVVDFDGKQFFDSKEEAVSEVIDAIYNKGNIREDNAKDLSLLPVNWDSSDNDSASIIRKCIERYDELEENNEYDSRKRRLQQVKNEVRIGTI